MQNGLPAILAKITEQEVNAVIGLYGGGIMIGTALVAAGAFLLSQKKEGRSRKITNAGMLCAVLGMTAFFLSLAQSIILEEHQRYETDPRTLLCKAVSGDTDFVTRADVLDLNGDGLPEIFLEGTEGWDYSILYYLNGEVRKVEGLEPWTWSSDLLYNEKGTLVLYACSHTEGTAGILQYRIYEWGKDGYTMTANLWCVPEEYTNLGEPVSYSYLLSETYGDPFEQAETGYEEFQVLSKEEFDRIVKNAGELTSIREGADSRYEPEQEFYDKIEEEILNWFPLIGQGDIRSEKSKFAPLLRYFHFAYVRYASFKCLAGTQIYLFSTLRPQILIFA